MTLLKLQEILGDEIKGIVDGTADVNEAKAVASLAKQMINNADIVLRTDKFTRSNGERIDKMVGNNNGFTA